jgi:hypothetical protein
LPNECLQYRVRHVNGVFEKGAEKSSRRQLQRKSEPVVAAAFDTDQQVVSVIEVEIARQLIGARIARIPTVTGVLFGSKELDGHRRKKRSSRALHKPSFAQRLLAHRPSRHCAVHKCIAK